MTSTIRQNQMEVTVLSAYNNNYKKKTLKEIRSNAKGQLVGRYSIAMFVTITISIIQLFALSLAESAYTGSIRTYLLRFVISIVIDLLTGILLYGQSHFYLDFVRNVQPLKASGIFHGFRHETDKAILIQGVFTLASILSSIPAVLISVEIITIPESAYETVSLLIYGFDFLLMLTANLFFGLSFFVLNDNPDLSVLEILRESMHLMQKKKGRYILLCLSALPLFILGFCACFVGIFWVAAYYRVLLTNFYLDAICEEVTLPYDDTESAKENSEPAKENSEGSDWFNY